VSDTPAIPRYVRYADLLAAGIFRSWTQAIRLIDEEGFPPGQLLSRNVRVWCWPDVEQWLATRPTARKVIPPTARRPKKSATVVERRKAASP
jgi:hypothetical protein